MKSKLTQGRYGAPKHSACGLCKSQKRVMGRIKEERGQQKENADDQQKYATAVRVEQGRNTSVLGFLRPIAEKLRMLDELRERTLAIRRASGSRKKAIVRETPLTDPP